MVQVLKEELRLAILRAAEDEFLKHGYTGASVKRMADQVGISVGNLYRYYKGKEALFDSVVGPVYLELEKMIKSQVTRPMDKGHIFELIVHALTELLERIRKPLLILIDGSQGTKHEDAKLKLYKLMADNVAQHLEAYNGVQEREVFAEGTAWSVSVAFMQGYFEIIRRHPDTEDCKSMVRQYFSFWYQGLQAFI
ncbi:TetR/AcrR family transcriptional regulator [Paenibacillus puerhi]|uniref:TetR/AcrR family transcriptional regulator n=1 Tax=Paenibacillus puerhi TaxID=2692622 RepID=UPI00135BEBFC|nr:TetR/AcrR family transcriptional regulator [Paenibacillus puerhi]